MESLIIMIITCILMIASMLFFPKIKIGHIKLDTYYLITVLGAIAVIIVNNIKLSEVLSIINNDSKMNPIKIIILFLSMAYLSIVLDQVGFFRYIALFAATKFKKSQVSLFIILFILVSILTIFTSNDIIILTFTPFICYFAKNAKINPLPYLIGEFFAANTLSMSLIIGNPTNIYIASSSSIDFIEYMQHMFIIGIFSAVVLLFLLLLIFRKPLHQKIELVDTECVLEDKFLLVIALLHLVSCTIIMAISNYIALEMYFVAFVFACSMALICLIYGIVKNKLSIFTSSLKRLPFPFIPFLLSMVIIVFSIRSTSVIQSFANFMAQSNSTMLYGISSLIVGNLINNIPMSVLYSDLLTTSLSSQTAIYAVIISSNLCALISPIGSLAGMMFIGLVKEQKIEFTFIKFCKYSYIPIILFVVATGLLLLLN